MSPLQVQDPPACSCLQDLRTLWTTWGLNHFVCESGDRIHLSQIEVPKNRRRQGLGTKAMAALICYANAQDKIITLSPSTDYGASAAGLRRFYARLGFVANKGRNKDFRFMETMYKRPDHPEQQPPAPRPRPR